MQQTSGWILAGVMALALGGCAAGSAPVEGVTAPANSPFAKIQLGMSKKQVKALVGAPSDESAHVTWKAFIPFYYGPDRSRLAYYYKGQGRVIFEQAGGFANHPTVTRVEYDPAEPGRAN